MSWLVSWNDRERERERESEKGGRTTSEWVGWLGSDGLLELECLLLLLGVVR